MKVFIAYADQKYETTRNFAGKMAKIFGNFDKVVLYGPKDIDQKFLSENKETFAIKRGAGLWLWKPYIIAKALREECSVGDYLFYGDAGSFFIRDVDHIIKAMWDESIYVSAVPLAEWQFTKADCFKLMGCHDEKIKETAQIQGSFLCLRKNHHTEVFINEWLGLCCDLKLLHPDNFALGSKNPDGFVAHREDQSILSLLCKKKGINPHLDPSQYGKYPEKYWSDNHKKTPLGVKKEYPVCIILHRTANVNKIVALKQLILALVPRRLGLHLIHN